MTRVSGDGRTVIATDLPCPPVNIGPRSTPDYSKLAAQAVHKVGRRKIFAGQRAEGFHVDLGSIFDLGTLRPFEHLHLIPSADAVGVDGTKALNVHSIALQVPITALTRAGGTPTTATRARRSGSGRRRAAASPGSSTTTPGRPTATVRGSRCRGWATRCSTR